MACFREDLKRTLWHCLMEIVGVAHIEEGVEFAPKDLCGHVDLTDLTRQVFAAAGKACKPMDDLEGSPGVGLTRSRRRSAHPHVE